MKVRKIAYIVLFSLTSYAYADDNISIRPLYGDRYVIENGVGKDLGYVRPLNDNTFIIEDSNGRDIGTIRRDEHDKLDLRDLCGNSRNSISCTLENENEEEDDD